MANPYNMFWAISLSSIFFATVICTCVNIKLGIVSHLDSKSDIPFLLESVFSTFILMTFFMGKIFEKIQPKFEKSMKNEEFKKSVFYLIVGFIVMLLYIPGSSVQMLCEIISYRAGD